MPKLIDYPRASLAASLSLAGAVDSLGGTCGRELAADKLDKKVSGAFAAVISTAARFGLIVVKKGQLSTTQLYRDYKLAYDEEQRVTALRTAFLSIPLFEQITDRFLGKQLPVDHFEKMLVKEFDVPDNIASRVAKYFIDGATQSGLLGEDNVLAVEPVDNYSGSNTISSDDSEAEYSESERDVAPRVIDEHATGPVAAKTGGYSIRMRGPGMDLDIQIHEEDDLLIVNAILAKIRKKMQDMKDEKPLDD